ncbi:hypothetical protein XENOCAPTIV_009611 [Xenoophorus captivus]|uniref:Prostate transmembrane protein, androgen induced 1 n=1 Tax=Xenoophorus captivus TaxID=1517983 RepID=A0ABV0RRP9_9TELE
MSYMQRDPQHNQPQPLLQSQRFQHTYAPSRFQPTYPYLPHSLIDLPPTISLSDGEEPPPYQGLCTLQLRDPEQQMELNRESVRPPPNRTVFDSHGLDPSNSCLQARYGPMLEIFLAGPMFSCCVHLLYLLPAPIILIPPPSSVPRLQAPPPSVHSGISVLEAQETLSRQQKQNSQVEGTPPTYSEAIGHFYHPATLTSNQTHRTVSTAPSSLIHGLLRPLPKQQGSVENRNTKEKPQKPQQV